MKINSNIFHLQNFIIKTFAIINTIDHYLFHNCHCYLINCISYFQKFLINHRVQFLFNEKKNYFDWH